MSFQTWAGIASPFLTGSPFSLCPHTGISATRSCQGRDEYLKHLVSEKIILFFLNDDDLNVK